MENLAIGTSLVHILLPIGLGLCRILADELGFPLGEGALIDQVTGAVGWSWIGLAPVLTGVVAWVNMRTKIRYLTGTNLVFLAFWLIYLIFAPCLPVPAICGGEPLLG